MTRSSELRTALLIVALLGALPALAESQAERKNDQRQHDPRLNQTEEVLEEIRRLPAPAAGETTTQTQTRRDQRLAHERKYEEFGSD